MSHEEAIAFIAAMESRAEVAPSVDLNIENWDALFGKEGVVNTPIGEVKMGDNQFTKMMREDRQGKLGMVKPTLENPDAILEDASKAKEGDAEERPSSYIFVKAFKKSDGSRYYYFTSVTVSKEGREVVVSNQEKRKNAIANLLSKDKLVWKHADDVSDASDVAQGLYSSQGNVSDLATEGTDAPQTSMSNIETSEPTNSRTDVDSYLKGKSDDTATRQNSDVSVDKVINKPLTLQENGEKSVGDKGVTPLSEGTLEDGADVNTEPTQVQREAGHYKRGRVQVGVFDETVAHSPAKAEIRQTESRGYSITPSTYTNKRGKRSDVWRLTFDHDLSADQGRAVKEFAKERMGDGRFAPARGWRDRESGGWMFRNEGDARRAARMVGDADAVAENQPLSVEQMRDAIELKEKQGKVGSATAKVEKQVADGTLRNDTEAKRLTTEAVLEGLNRGGIPVELVSDEQAAQMLGKHVDAGNGVLFDEKDLEVTDHVQFMKRASGRLYGWTVGGKIYLTKDGLNPNTPIHEYTHLWAEAMKECNPVGWQDVKALLLDTPVWKEVLADKNYEYIHDDADAVASEVLSRISGKKNAEKMEAEAEKMIDEAKDRSEKARAVSLLDGMKKALEKFWSWVGKDLLGIKKFSSVEEVTDRVLYDFVNGTELRWDKQGDKLLVAVHNISEDKLKDAFELGGLAMPSIAITKADIGHTGFGEISLIFDKSSIDPSDRRNKVYSGDAWTPTFPQIDYKLNDGKTKSIYRRANNVGDLPMFRSVDFDSDNYARYIDGRGAAGLVEHFKDDYSAKQMYLSEKGNAVENFVEHRVEKYSKKEISLYKKVLDKIGIERLKNEGYDLLKGDLEELVAQHYGLNVGQSTPFSLRARIKAVIRNAVDYSEHGNSEIKKDFEATRKEIDERINDEQFTAWLEELFSGIVEKKGIRNERDMFTSSGNRRGWEKLYDAVTLDNVVKFMQREPKRGGEGLFNSSIFGASAKALSSMEDIRREAKSRINSISDENLEKEKDRIVQRLNKIILPSADKGVSEVFDFIDNVNTAVSKSHDARGIYKNLRGYYPDMTMNVAKEIAEIVSDIQKMSTKYFEAKPYRAIGFDEVRVALVPEGVSQDILDGLRQRGIEVRTYEKGNERARQKAVSSVTKEMGIRFQIVDNGMAEEEVNEQFNRELAGLTEENADTKVFNLGSPSWILLSAGVEDKPMKLYGNKVIKKMKKHGFALEELRDLPKAVADPIAVFNNDQRKGNRVILTELPSQGKNIMVAVTPHKNGVDVDFNIVSSVFGKGGSNIVDWINKGYLTYIDKEKALHYLYFSERNVSEAADNVGGEGSNNLYLSAPIAEAAENSELSSAAKVVKDFVNPNIGEEKNSLRAGEAMNDAMMEGVKQLAERLHTPVRIIGTQEEVSALPSVRQRRMKGSFNSVTGEVTIVLPNHGDVGDVVKTVLHEVVGHDGLRVLFAEEGRLNHALDELYRVSSEGIRQSIDRMAERMYAAQVDRLREKRGGQREAKGEKRGAYYYADMADAHVEADRLRVQFRRDATEEYGAVLAGRIGVGGFERMSEEELTFWGRLKSMLQKALQRLLEGLKIPGKMIWGDKEWAFVLHEAYKRKRNGGDLTVPGAADTEADREKTGFGEMKFNDGKNKGNEPKPIGRSTFGSVYNQFKGKVLQAVKFLVNHESGDLLGVFHRKDIGDIDMVWGDDGGGLCHILNKHINDKDFPTVKDLVSRIEDIVNNGKVDFSNGDKMVLKKDGYAVTIRRNVREKGIKIADKNWVLTAYNKDAPANTKAPADGTHGSTAVAPGTSSDAKIATLSEINEFSGDNVSDNDMKFRDGDMALGDGGSDGSVDAAIGRVRELYEGAVRDTGGRTLLGAFARSLVSVDARRRFVNEFSESYFDYSRALKRLQGAIEGGLGVKLEGFEDVWRSLNAKGSVDAAEVDMVMRRYVAPLADHIGGMTVGRSLGGRALGVEDRPMKLYGNKVMKKMRKHGFALGELRDLPRAVADPIAVFNNYKTDGNRSILTELRGRHGNFLVSVNIGKDADIDFNIVRSVFGKGDENVVDWINKGWATYINKEKALSFLSHQSAPIAATAANAGQSSDGLFAASQYVQQEIDELDTAAKVVKDFVNPKISEGNAGDGGETLGRSENDIETINAKFNEELQQRIDGKLADGHIYKMGNPGRILLSTGVDDLPIQMNAKRLQAKEASYGHDFDLSEVRDLVRALQRPLAVFAYGDRSRAQNIIVPLQKEGKNFIVGLSLNPTVGGGKLEINSIRNVFPKNNSEWLNWISQGKTLYMDKEKIQTLIDQQRTVLADVDYLDLDSIAKVVKDFVNPKISEGNAGDGGLLLRDGGVGDVDAAMGRVRELYEQAVRDTGGRIHVLSLHWLCCRG